MSETAFRIEKDSLGEVQVPADKLWGAQTQRSIQHFSIGTELMPREMIGAYAILKMAAARANHAIGWLDASATRSSCASATRSSPASIAICSPCMYG